ncbi:iron-containing alcohol dehydrogenase [Rhodovulum sulfidophilum]|uniref:iron-containing alcohol dehydrogenase n=1 Tax=Rhodovulum sulfidophilum TaxID=35806 RepID=UPI0019252E6E|nr:iron-containing alcohol dehydrogenase [Rhodovulum sulfidophilum]MBL3586291.1 iron-containing alcohol dehydrogenase [Rhodovulum sulfidophilum]
MTRYTSFQTRTEIVFGPGLLDRLHAYRGQKVGIVTDAFLAQSGALDRVRKALPDCQIRVFDEVVPDTPIDAVSAGARHLGGFGPEVIIALGGGSPIDGAKAILAIVREMHPDRYIPFVAIPTTSGTGSEVTTFAVISDPANGRKFPLISEELVPDVALLDPEFVRTAPPKVTADTGMDVITHALEAVVARGANHFTDAFADKALSLAFAHLPRAYADGNDMDARDAMHQASCLAGFAFAAAGLGVNHSLAHALGGKLHVVHGRTNSVLLPVVIPWNAVEPRAAAAYARIARLIGLDAPDTGAAVTALIAKIREFNTLFGIPATIPEIGADKEEYRRVRSVVAAAALADACTTSNPRQPSQADLEDLLAQVGG